MVCAVSSLGLLIYLEIKRGLSSYFDLIYNSCWALRYCWKPQKQEFMDYKLGHSHSHETCLCLALAWVRQSSRLGYSLDSLPKTS